MKDLLEERREIDYLTNCIKTNTAVSNFFEFKCTNKEEGKIGLFTSKEESLVGFEHKGRLVYFTLKRDEEGHFLHKINYFKNSFHKNIFFDYSLNRYSVTSQTSFRVIMSEDKLSIFFFLINPDNVKIWVLSNGNTVYTP